MSPNRFFVILAELSACCLIVGCGARGLATDPGPLKDREAIAKQLPPGVTLESTVVPNMMYGNSAKTVEDALAGLQAYVRDGAIHDGGLGSEIQFKRDGKVVADSKGPDRPKKRGKIQPSITVIELAK